MMGLTVFHRYREREEAENPLRQGTRGLTRSSAENRSGNDRYIVSSGVILMQFGWYHGTYAFVPYIWGESFFYEVFLWNGQVLTN